MAKQPSRTNSNRGPHRSVVSSRHPSVPLPSMLVETGLGATGVGITGQTNAPLTRTTRIGGRPSEITPRT